MGSMLFAVVAVGAAVITPSVQGRISTAAQSPWGIVLCAIAGIALFGWLGSLPNPNCDKMDDMPDAEAIREVLRLDAPDLVDDFDKLVAVEE